MTRSPPRSPLFPYTTLFRSGHVARDVVVGHPHVGSALDVGVTAQGVHPATRHAHVPQQQLEHGGRLDQLDREAVDRKSTRLNSSHRTISYAVFCLKKKKKET